MVTIKITLKSVFGSKDLEIFREFRLCKRPFLTLSGCSEELIRMQNKRFFELSRKSMLKSVEKKELEELICLAWEQYITLYEEGFWLRRLLRKFQCKVMDSYDHFGIDPLAVYTTVVNGKAVPFDTGGA